MAKRDSRAQLNKTIDGELKRLSAIKVDARTGEYSKAAERKVQASLARLDKNWHDFRAIIHAWIFPGPKD